METLKQSNETPKEDKIRLNIDLKLEILFTDHFKKLYEAQMMKENKDFDSWKKEVANRKCLEAEIDTLRKDKKRKRQEVGPYGSGLRVSGLTNEYCTQGGSKIGQTSVVVESSR